MSSESNYPPSIYVLPDPAMPDMVKLGQSTRRPMPWAIELPSTGMSRLFDRGFSVNVSNPVGLVDYHVHTKRYGYPSSMDGLQVMRRAMKQVPKEMVSKGGEIALQSAPWILMCPPGRMQSLFQNLAIPSGNPNRGGMCLDNHSVFEDVACFNGRMLERAGNLTCDLSMDLWS